MTPAAARLRVRIETRRVRTTARVHTESLDRFAATVETARDAGVTWPLIVEDTGWSESTIRQKLREARRRREKRGGS